MADADRYFYFRAHAHPLGWGVGDSKAGTVEAFGDKTICFVLASILNGRPEQAYMLRIWPELHDTARQFGAPAYRYNPGTGGLDPIITTTKGEKHGGE